jgi:mono/diheme cytochrome c family protein
VIGYKRGVSEKLIKLLLQGMEGPVEVLGKSYNNAMPAHSFLTNEAAARILTYIRNNFGNKAAPISASEVDAVRKTLTVK